MSVNMDDIPEDKTKELLNDMLHRIEALEEQVSRLPCDHIGYPIDEGYELDDDDFEIRVETCRNCGERVL
tara:strand:- start:178 stop:387 length:210 start_codon:yes stop_codon:yes gene_type:complete